jgi:DNA-binding transcriptional LysR family regulator
VLTEAGARYLARVEALLDELAEATADLERSDAKTILTVSAGPSIIARWLIPRLGRLVERHDIDVRVVASPSVIDFAHDEVDVAIRHGCGTYEGLRSDLLLREESFPSVAPRCWPADRAFASPPICRSTFCCINRMLRGLTGTRILTILLVGRTGSPRSE